MIRALTLTAGLAIAYFALRVTIKPIPGKRQKSKKSRPDLDWLAQLQGEITKSHAQLDPTALVAFIDLITNPPEHRSRVAETIDLDGHSIKKRVSVEFVLPGNLPGAEYIHVPVLQPASRDLLDRFRLTDASGTSITSLSYLETVELAAVGLRTLLLYATGMSYGQWSTTRTAELILLRLITRHRPPSKQVMRSGFEKGLALLEGNVPDESLALVQSYVESLSSGDPIVAAVPQNLVVANRVLICYEHTVIPTSDSVGALGKLRLGLGVRPSQVTIPVDLAMTTSSYHLRINGPPEKYVVDQTLKCARCRRKAFADSRTPLQISCKHKIKTGGSSDRYLYMRGLFGQNFTHLYMRGFARERHRSDSYEVLVSFSERPPGSSASATITALAALIFIWVIGHVLSNRETVNSDLPAILLTLPAIAASWFGLASDGKTLVGSSLHARLSLIMSGCLSVASVIVYLMQSATLGSSVKIHAHPHVTLAGVSDLGWVILLSLAFLNFVFIARHFTTRVVRYMRLISRPDPLTNNHSVV